MNPATVSIMDGFANVVQNEMVPTQVLPNSYH